MYSIREALISDAKRLKNLYASILNEGLPYVLKNEVPSVEAEESFIRSLKHAGGTVLVAEMEGGVLIGMLSINRLAHPQLCHRASFGVSVAADYRNNGVGAALISQAIGWCRSQAIMQLSLEVMDGNPSKKLYSRLGFSEIGRNPQGVCVDGACRELLTMAIDIN